MNRAKQTPRAIYPVFPVVAGFLRPYPLQLIIFLTALLITSAGTLALGQGLKFVIDEGMVAQSFDYLYSAVVFFCVLAVVMAVGTYIRFFMISWLGERVCADIRASVFDHIIELHPGYFETHQSGSIVSRLTTDTTLLQSIIGSGFSLALRSSVTFLGATVMLVFTDARLALLVLVIVPLLLIPVIVLGRKVRILSRESQDSLADVGNYAGEIIRQIKVVQSYTRETYEKLAFQNEVERAFGIAVGRIRQRSLLTAIVILAMFIALASMVWVGGGAVISGSISAGDLGAFIFYAALMAMALATLSEVFGELQRAAGAADRLVELLHADNMILSMQPEDNDAFDIGSAALSFQNVTFNYATRLEKPAVKDFTLLIKPGQVTAIVGPSGAGKSTLFDLIQRFYDPKFGRITLGERDLKHFKLTTLRKHFGLVRQQLTLFSGTIRHNIVYGYPEADNQAIETSAKAAQAHEFIMQLPDAYDTNIGEQGVALSGGQRQRIALARVFLKNPDILLLDEATSSLDAESENAVQLALGQLMKGRTTVIIAHHLSSVLLADKIVVVDEGQVVAEGSHEILMSESALYRRLIELQFNTIRANETA